MQLAITNFLLQMSTEYVTMRDDNGIPMVAFGTAKLGDKTEEYVLEAIEAGYRHFDCARYYGNEKLVGRALIKSGIPRSSIFICSKVWTESIANQTVDDSLRATLEDLQLDYLDLYLVHWPVPNGYHVKAWKELIRLRDMGLIRSIGVSNYTIEDIEELREAGLEFPACNKLEVSPFLYRRKTIEYLQSHGIHVTSYRSLHKGKQGSLNHPIVVRIAYEHHVSAAQVLLRWCVQKKITPIPGSRDPDRMRSNLKIFDWTLDDQDIHLLDQLTSFETIEDFVVEYKLTSIRNTHLGRSYVRDDFTKL